MLSRRAKEADISQLVDLVNSVYRGESAQKSWTTEAALLDGQRADTIMLTNVVASTTQRIFVLEENGKILGCVQSTDEGRDVLLGMLSVPVELQGRGLGRKLVELVEDDARARGFDCIKMHVLFMRTELLNWYYRLGYENSGEKKAWPYGDLKWGIPKREDLEFLVLSKTL